MYNKKFFISVISIVFFIGIIAIAHAQGDTREKRFEKAAEFISGGKVSITLTNGIVQFHSWEKDQVQVTAVVKVQGSTEEIVDDVLNDIQLRLDRNSGALEIIIDIPALDEFGSDGILSWLFGGGRPSVSANLTICLPFISSVDAKTLNGNVFVDSLRGDVWGKTTNGRIGIGSLFGNAIARSTNGSIRVEMAMGGVDVQTTNGSVDIRTGGEGTLNQDIRCKTTNGSINLEIPRPLDCSIDAGTVNGGVTVSIPEIIDAELFLSTVNGRMTTDFPVTKRGEVSKRKLEGIIGKGGNVIRLKTVNGSISLSKLE